MYLTLLLLRESEEWLAPNFSIHVHKYTQTTMICLQLLTNRHTPEVESCVNILKVEGGKQCVKMSSTVYQKSKSCINILEVKGHEQCVNMSCMKRQNDNMDQVKRQLFIDEAYLKTSAWKGVLKTSTKTKISTYNYPSTTTLLSGGLVHEISRSFHYWQLAPKWRLLPWLANPGNPAMSPHTGKGNRHPTHW